MATQQDLIRERELLGGLGLPPVRVWPPQCVWYRADGSVVGKRPCDPYSRLLYMGRGLSPGIAMVKRESVPAAPTLLDAVTTMMQDRDTWEGTATDLLTTLDGKCDEVPVDATRLSKTLSKLVSQLEGAGIRLERLTRGRQRTLRLCR